MRWAAGEECGICVPADEHFGSGHVKVSRIMERALYFLVKIWTVGVVPEDPEAGRRIGKFLGAVELRDGTAARRRYYRELLVLSEIDIQRLRNRLCCDVLTGPASPQCCGCGL